MNNKLNVTKIELNTKSVAEIYGRNVMCILSRHLLDKLQKHGLGIQLTTSNGRAYDFTEKFLAFALNGARDHFENDLDKAFFTIAQLDSTKRVRNGRR